VTHGWGSISQLRDSNFSRPAARKSRRLIVPNIEYSFPGRSDFPIDEIDVRNTSSPATSYILALDTGFCLYLRSIAKILEGVYWSVQLQEEFCTAPPSIGPVINIGSAVYSCAVKANV